MMISRLWLARPGILLRADEAPFLACDEVGPDRRCCRRAVILGRVSRQAHRLSSAWPSTTARSCRRYTPPRRTSRRASCLRTRPAPAAMAQTASAKRRPFRISRASAPPICSIELKAYQAGARGDTPMNGQVKFLSDDALLKVSAYFASLDPPQAAAANPAKVAIDPVQAGKTAAAACAGCHGESGVSTTPGMPSLAGLDPKYTVAAMKAYKSGQRESDLMKSMVASLTEPVMDNIALYYGLQKPAPSKAPAAGDKAAGATAAAGCAGCHGSDGVSANPAFPSLAGQDAGYLAGALAAYKQGTRKDETMKGLAAGLDDAAMKNLAAFFTSSGAEAARCSQASDRRRVGAEMRPLPRYQRQQRRPATARFGRAARGLSRESAERLPRRRAQESANGGDVRRADGPGYFRPCRTLCAQDGARGRVCDAAAQVSSRARWPVGREGER